MWGRALSRIAAPLFARIQTMASLSKQTLFKILATTAVTVGLAGAAGVWWMKTHSGPGAAGGDAVLPNANAPFVVSSCMARLHDDKPALAIMFSGNVDGGQSLEKLIEVADLGDASAPDSANSAKPKAPAGTPGKSAGGIELMGKGVQQEDDGTTALLNSYRRKLSMALN